MSGSGRVPSQTPTLVSLHEGRGCLAMWRDFPAQLAPRAGCGALIYSRSGYGNSTPLAGRRTSRYLHHEALNVLPEVLRALDIQRPILIGHSDGASIALIYAGRDIYDPRAVIVEAPHVLVEEKTLAGIRRAGELYRQTDLAQRLTRYHGDQTSSVFWDWYDLWLSPEFRDWNIEGVLPQITCPLMIVQGEDDEYGTKTEVDAIASQVAGASEVLVLSDCGHTPHRDRSESTLAAMAGFIRKLAP